MEKQMVMKKFTAALVLLGMIIGTAACSSDNKFKEKSDVSLSNYDDYKVEMSVEVVRNRKLMVSLINHSDRTYMYGRAYTLEYQKNGEWYKVPMDVIFTMEGIMLGPHVEPGAETASADIILGDTSSVPVYLEDIGKLPAGHYRIIKDISSLGDDGYPTATYLMAAEFDLAKEQKEDPKHIVSEIPEDRITDESSYKLPVSSVKKTDKKTLTIYFENYSASGEFVLQYHKNGQWYDVPVRNIGGAASSIPTEENYLILYTEDPLSSGKYRLLHNYGLLTSENDSYFSYTFEL